MLNKITRYIICLLIALSVVPSGIYALEPAEVLRDPVLEERARILSAQLRCPVCQNQSIDDSDAPLARDLRVLIRERLLRGDADAEVLSYITARYGEFVLLKPTLSAKNGVLWAAPLLFLLIGVFMGWRYIRHVLKA